MQPGAAQAGIDLHIRLAGVLEITSFDQLRSVAVRLNLALFIDAVTVINKMGRDVSAMMARLRLRYRRTRSLRNPMSRPSMYGPLQRGRASLHKWDTSGKTSATHQTGRLQNPNSRNHRGRCDDNRAVHTGETIEFDRLLIPPA